MPTLVATQAAVQIQFHPSSLEQFYLCNMLSP